MPLLCLNYIAFLKGLGTFPTLLCVLL
jgi:hypothetical protein